MRPTRHNQYLRVSTECNMNQATGLARSRAARHSRGRYRAPSGPVTLFSRRLLAPAVLPARVRRAPHRQYRLATVGVLPWMLTSGTPSGSCSQCCLLVYLVWLQILEAAALLVQSSQNPPPKRREDPAEGEDQVSFPLYAAAYLNMSV